MLFDSIMCNVHASHTHTQVTLVGSLEDWHKLKAKCVTLKNMKLGLDAWIDSVIDIVANIVKTVDAHAKGSSSSDSDSDSTEETAKKFWRSIYHYGQASGGPRITGWAACLFAYLTTRKGGFTQNTYKWSKWGWGVSPGEFPPSFTSAPMTSLRAHWLAQ